MKYYSILAVTAKTEDWIPDYIGSAKKLVADMEVNTWQEQQLVNKLKELTQYQH